MTSTLHGDGPASAAGPGRPTVGSAMVRRPKVCDAGATAAEIERYFTDDHVHAVLVAEHGVLLTVVERDDLTSADPGTPAREIGTLEGRVVGPGADLEETRRAMGRGPRRRLAVVDAHDVLLGLLCLKRTGRGFCTDDDVAARAAELGRALPPPAGDAAIPCGDRRPRRTGGRAAGPDRRR